MCRELKVNTVDTRNGKEHKQNDKIFRPIDYRQAMKKSNSFCSPTPAELLPIPNFGEYNALLLLFNITTENGGRITGKLCRVYYTFR